MKTTRAALTAALLLLVPVGARPQQSAPPPPPPAPPPPPTEAEPGAPQTPPLGVPSSGGRYLLLPDISFIGNLVGRLSSDKRDRGRDRFRLDEGEVGIQSAVYPGIQAQVFIVFGDQEAVVEEGYLSVADIGLGGLPLSATIGRRKVPFGRVNQLHPHSWLYVVQPYVLSNLVSGESLTGDGGYLSYLLPTGKLFAQLDAGFWSQSETGEDIDADQDPSQAVLTSPGAGYVDKFTTLRLWTATETLGGSLEIGGSLARGKGVEYSLPTIDAIRPTIQLSSLDLSFRRQGQAASRFLLRGEYVRHRQKDSGFERTAGGYYVFVDQRFNPQTSLGLRYDQSQFPYAGENARESGVSLIGTRQLNEQTYVRLQLINGRRPGQSNVTEGHLQFVFGLGPHTHSLE